MHARCQHVPPRGTGLSSTVWATWGRDPSHSKMMPSLRLPDIRSRSWCAHYEEFRRFIAYEFQQADILPLQGTESLPSGTVWTATRPSRGAVQSPARVTHSVRCTVFCTSVCNCVHRDKGAATPSTLPQQRRERVSVEHALH